MPTLIKPVSSNPTVESTVKLVTEAFIAPFISVVLVSSPIVSTDVTRLTSARRSISKLSEPVAAVVPLTPLVIPDKVSVFAAEPDRGLEVVSAVQPV